VSQLKVNSVVDASGGNTATINGVAPTVYNTMGRNRIINGDMRIDQRNAGASVSVTSAAQQFAVDRFQIQCATDGTLAAQRSTTAPAGFTNSLLLTVSVADASLASGQIARIRHKIEGFNAADLAFGTAGASSVTISFWVRSSVTGTFAGYLINSAANRSCPFTFTINSANTFEQKSVTLTGDTTGTWLTDSGMGIELGITLGAGSAYNGTANTWAAAEYYTVSGATNLLATSSATFYITGVQLEAGTVAYPYERRDYGPELMMCQRYFEALSANASGALGAGQFITLGVCETTTRVQPYYSFKVQKRVAPSTTLSTISSFGIRSAGSSVACSSGAFGSYSTAYAQGEFNNAGGGLVAGGCGWLTNHTGAATIEWSAEL